jgi:hypothetical protein
MAAMSPGTTAAREGTATGEAEMSLRTQFGPPLVAENAAARPLLDDARRLENLAEQADRLSDAAATALQALQSLATRPLAGICDHGCVPDWTYHPLRPFAAAVLGRRRSQRAALRALATLTALPGGARLVAALAGHPRPPAGVATRLGAVVPVEAARDALRALPPLGAGVIELGPVGAADVALVRRAVAGRRCAVIARATEPRWRFSSHPTSTGWSPAMNRT